MSRSKAIKEAQKRIPLKFLKDEHIVRLLNSWVIQNERVSDWELLPDNKKAARKCFEDQMRIAMCIAKRKEEITAKPHKAEQPTKGFFEFCHKMRDTAVERSFKYYFPKKLHNGSRILMIDGIYIVENLNVPEDGKHGSLDLIKDDLVYHLEWGMNPPKFYYLKEMDMEDTRISEGFNKNSTKLDQLRANLSKMKASIDAISSLGLDCEKLWNDYHDIEDKIEHMISK